MKKKLIYLLLSCTLAQGFVACDTVDFGDTNDNRNGATQPYTAGLLSGAIMDYATVTGRSNLLVPTLLVQWQTQVVYTDEMLYAQAPYSWRMYYTYILPALNEVIAYNQDESNITSAQLAQGAPENQIGVAMIMKAIVMKRVTDTWGDAPYSQAFLGAENLTPEYDSQEQIYATLINELKEGRDMLDAAKNGPTGDILYGGDVTKWQKLANSVLMQMALQMSEVDPTTGKAVFNEALESEHGYIDEVSEEAWFEYGELAAFNNPFNANRTADYFLSKEFTDALKGLDTELNPTSNRTFDDRINVYGTSATADGIPYGFADGSGPANQISAEYYWNATAPLPMMTASYTFLNRAEAAALGWTTEIAAELLVEGIKMSFATLEAHTGEDITDGSTYAAARVADSATEGLLTVIREEKWKSLFPQGFDAWAEWRRTGVPDLDPAADAVNDGSIPTRYLYPIEETTLNPTNNTAGIGGLSPASNTNTSKVWWDVN